MTLSGGGGGGDKRNGMNFLWLISAEGGEGGGSKGGEKLRTAEERSMEERMEEKRSTTCGSFHYLGAVLAHNL